MRKGSWKIATKMHNILLSGLSAAQGSSVELATPKPDRYFVEEASGIEDLNQPEATAVNLSSEERQQLLVEWNSTDTPYPAQKTIHGMFEEQVKKHRIIWH